MTKMNPAQKMLEEARLEHLRKSSQPFKVTPKVDVTSIMCNRRVTDKNLRKIMGVDMSVRICYIPIISKMVQIHLMELICDMLIKSKVVDTKKYINEFKEIKAKFFEDLNSDDMPEDTERIISILSEWFWNDHMRNAIVCLYTAYDNVLLEGKSTESNTASLLAWIFGTRDLARETYKYNVNRAQYINEIWDTSVLRRVYITDNDVSKRVMSVCDKIIESAYGCKYNLNNKAITEARKAVYNKIAFYEAITPLSEAMAQMCLEDKGKDCLVERCRDCEFCHCKTYDKFRKEVLNNNQK